MKSNRKIIAIIFVIIAIICTACGVVELKESTIEKVSEASIKELDRISHKEYIIQEVEEGGTVLEKINENTSNENGNQANSNILVENEIEESNENIEHNYYEEGKAIIIYKPNAKINTNSIFNNYKIENTVEFGEENEDSAMSVSVISSDKHSTNELIEKMNQKDGVITAIPDFQFSTSALTEDENANLQWALENNGQFGGTKGKDIAPLTTSSGNQKVIAIIDSGVDYTNEDLVNIMWKNPFDENTLPGTYGYDFVNGDTDPMDDNGHGVGGIVPVYQLVLRQPGVDIQGGIQKIGDFDNVRHGFLLIT